MPDEDGAPDVTIAFPLPGSVAAGASMTVRGTATDMSGVAVIRVNGVEAELSEDGGAVSWQASVPLQAGGNELVVESEDTQHNAEAEAAKVTVDAMPAMLAGAGAVGLDAAGERVLILDDRRQALFSMEVSTGILSHIAELASLVEDAGDSGYVHGLAVDTGAQQALVLAGTTGSDASLVAVDLATGEVEIVSDAEANAEYDIVDPHSLMLDAGQDRAVVLDWKCEATCTYNVVGIALGSGERTVLASAIDTDDGETPHLAGPLALVPDTRADAPQGQVLILDQSRIVALDLASGGFETVVSSLRRPEEPFYVPTGLALDADQNRVLLAGIDFISGASVWRTVDLGTEEVMPWFTGTPVRGYLPLGSGRMVLDAAGGRLWVPGGVAGLFAIDLETTAGTLWAAPLVGKGPELTLIMDMVWDPEAQRLLLLREDGALYAVDGDGGERSLAFEPEAEAQAWSLALEGTDEGVRVWIGGEADVASVDLATGERRVLAEIGRDSPLGIERATSVAVDQARGRLLVVNREQASVFALDMSTRMVSVVASSEIGAGVEIVQPASVDVDAAQSRALVWDEGAAESVYAIDLETGDGSLLSLHDAAQPDNSVGAGPKLAPAVSVTLDAAHARMLLTSRSLDALAAVDLATGDRAILSDPASAGPGVLEIGAVALDAQREVAFVFDNVSSALLAVDVHTGERVIVSRGRR